MKESFPRNPIHAVESTPQGRFSKVAESTMCPFAKKSFLEFADEWEEKLSFEENMARVAVELKKFTEECEELGLDGFVMEAKGEEYSKDIPALSAFLRNTLKTLQKYDEQGQHPMDRDIAGKDWQFSFNSVNLFITTFAPFYPKESPRYSFTDDSVFVFFQPNSSFNTHIVNPANDPRTIKLKQNIRKSFEDDGRPYDQNIVDSPVEAVKYIKPLRVGDAEVRWWENDTKDVGE